MSRPNLLFCGRLSWPTPSVLRAFLRKKKITLASSRFSWIIKKLSLFGNTVTLTADLGKVVFSVPNEVFGCEIILKTQKKRNRGAEGCRIDVAHGHKWNATVALSFNLKYFAMVAKCQKFGKTVELKVGQDLPLRLHYGTEEDAQQGYVSFYIAPQVFRPDSYSIE